MVGDVWVGAEGALSFGGSVVVLCFVMFEEDGEEFELGAGLEMSTGDVCLTG